MQVDSVAVVGLGYVGWPLVQAASGAGFRVLGIDLDSERLSFLRSQRVGTNVSIQLAGVFDQIGEAGVIVICVPTPMDAEMHPDYSFVVRSLYSIGPLLRKGQLIVLESTVAPGTTKGLVLDILESESGLKAGRDFHLAFSPERIDPANEEFFLTNTPKIVGGFSEPCSKAAHNFYSRFVENVVIAKGLDEAEAAKILENTYRHVNISLINEFAEICRGLGIDSRNVIELASTKPFGFQKFSPSVGAGGHCIPVDPNYLAHLARATLRKPFRMVELSNEINKARPRQVASYILDASLEMQSPSKSVLVLGLSYKANVGDFRESMQLELAKELASLGLNVSIHDPYLSAMKELEFRQVDSALLDEELANASLVVLSQFHNEYSEVVQLESVQKKLFNATGIITPARWGL